MERKPIQFKRLTTGLEISWSDGSVFEIKSEKLRKSCPCAECKEKRGDTSHSTPLTPRTSMLNIVTSSREEELALQRIWPVGTYALGMEWGDGHSTGIYTYTLLNELSR